MADSTKNSESIVRHDMSIGLDPFDLEVPDIHMTPDNYFLPTLDKLKQKHHSHPMHHKPHHKHHHSHHIHHTHHTHHKHRHTTVA